MRQSQALRWAVPPLVVLLGFACGGGEEATPTRPATRAPAPTAVAAPAATATPQPTPTATPQPAPTAALRPAATPAAQPTATPATAIPTGRLRIAVATFGQESLDPSMDNASVFGTNAAPLYDWLVWNAKEGTIAPGVATSWEMSPDGKTWTYKLRSGMRFHNGDPVAAEDVKFSIEWKIRPETVSSQAATWKAMAPVAEMVSADTVRVTAKTPWPLMPYAASARDGSEGTILPKRYAERVGAADFAKSPVGTGPFKFVRHDVGVRYLFEANTMPHPYRQVPKFKELEYLLIPEESTRLAMVRTGQADIVDISPSSVPAVKSANLQVFSIAGSVTGGAYVFGWGDPRLEGKPLAKKETRKALFLALNRKEMVETLLEGMAEVPARLIVTPGSLGYDPSWKLDPYDPAQARKLLADAGYPGGFSLQIYTFPHPSAPWLPLAAQAMAGYWSAIGVTSRITPIDSGAIRVMYTARPQPDELIGAVMTQIVPVSSTNIVYFTNYYASSGVFRFFNSPELDAMVKEAIAAVDPQKRVELIQKVTEWTYKEYQNMPLAVTPALYAASSKLGGWNPINAARIGHFLEEVRPK